MDNLENELKKVLSTEGRFDTAKAEIIRKETVQMFEEKLKRVKAITWAFLVIDAVIMYALAKSFLRSEDTKTTIMLAVIFLVVYESTVLIKLWYWIMNNKLNVLKEIKQLQLQIAELAGKKQPSEN